jgi:plasmid stabilization system protein ParE
MEYRVRLLPRAQNDIEELYDWVIQRTPQQGHGWYTGLIEAIDSLRQHPYRCSTAPESSEFKEPVRQLLYGKRPYRILFWIQGKEVQVLHVRRGARQPWRDAL